MNRLWLIVAGCIAGLVCACSNKDNAPAGIIPKEKMEAVLWDMIQAERYTSSYMANDTSKNIKLENFKLYDQIFQIHQTNKEEFIKSYKFYLSRPDIARVLFDSLTTRSNREREELYKPKVDTASADSAKTTQPGTVRTDSPKVTQPAPPAQPARPLTPVKDTLRVKQKPTDTVRLRTIPDSLRRRLLKPKHRSLLRPGMYNRDSLLRRSQ